MLCVAEGADAPQALFRIEGEQAWELCEVTGPRAPVNFVEIKNLVYASNPYWKTAYDTPGGQAKVLGDLSAPGPKGEPGGRRHAPRDLFCGLHAKSEGDHLGGMAR